MECKDFLYFIDELNNVIYFNPIYVWESEGCLADMYSDEEDAVIEDVAKELNLIGSVESGYEPAKSRKAIGYESKLIELGFVYDAKFAKFMKTCLCNSDEYDEENLNDDYSDEPEELNFE